MYKRKLKSYIAMAMVTLLFATCSKSDENGVYFYSTIDLKASSLNPPYSSTITQHERSAAVYSFSTDNGATFTDASTLKPGQKFQVIVGTIGCSDCLYGPSSLFVNSGSAQFTAPNFYTLDWSASTPAPSSAASESPEFTMQSSNNIAVKVIDVHCNYDANSWTGAWTADEGLVTQTFPVVSPPPTFAGSSDANNITNFAAKPDSLIMDNFFGDNVTAYMKFAPSTSTTAYWGQTLTMPTQDTSEGGVASGTGYYDQCRGFFILFTTYSVGGKTYTWTYKFHR